MENGTRFVGTSTHPVWNPQLKQWLPLEELLVGDWIDTLDGELRVASIRPLQASQDVFNLEVHGHHVYRIADVGVLVHNNNDCVGDLVPEVPSGGVDLTLKYKADWTDAQRAAADAKARALTEANTVVTPHTVRSGTTQARYRREQGLGQGVDADHTVDLQLGGADDILNMSALDSSVNRSLGSQIKTKIKSLPAGTLVNNVKMVNP